MPDVITIDGNSLTIGDVVAVARGGARVALSKSACERMARVRRVVDDIVQSGAVVYGVTTGFGKLADVAIPRERLDELQTNLVRSHAIGVGPLLAEDETRAVMLLRANVLAKGLSGPRPVLVDRIIGLLNAGLYPPIPEQGSVGASGDLAPLAHVALALMGEGDLLCGGQRQGALTWMRERGIEPVSLGPKEGIALLNGTQAHTGLGTLLISDAITLWQTAHVAGAATLDALRGTPAAFDERIHAARGQVGQQLSAALLRDLTSGSAIRESHRMHDPRVQDAYALRCMPQVLGPAYDAIGFASGVIARELNAATDNPLVFEDGSILSGGNFHGQSVAMVLDFLAIVLTNIATTSERRIDRLVNPDLNEGLPPFLAREAGVNSGLMMLQVNAAALASECKVLAHPASVDTIPTDGGKEDVVPMAMGSAIKLRRIVHNVKHVVAIELLCAMQGLEFRRPLRSSPRIEEAFARVRRHVAPLDRDRVLMDELAALTSAVGTGAFSDLAPWPT
ncbi:MAG TPA: histidine ammonia-lyase [Gemmatimonadaceae bacterium]|nr:histidine ammonia-lyase [Gemmatimonadaceae bacterium]